MIELHRLQNQKIIVSADLIEFLESTPDTIISTTTGKKIIVKESVDEVIQKVIAYKKEFTSPRKRKA
ncbi:MAG: flagellar FlbD family protein [Ignavibacteriales bacterium]|nr:flagellar FlbD family protein [Ignavibacteriales bacterium]